MKEMQVIAEKKEPGKHFVDVPNDVLITILDIAYDLRMVLTLYFGDDWADDMLSIWDAELDER